MKKRDLLIIAVLLLVLVGTVALVAVIGKKHFPKSKDVTKRTTSVDSAFDPETLALSVIRGDYGNEPERTVNLLAEGYTPEQIKEIQSIVNETIY